MSSPTADDDGTAAASSSTKLIANDDEHTNNDNNDAFFSQCVEVIIVVVEYLTSDDILGTRHVNTLWRELSRQRLSNLSCHFLSRLPVQEEPIELSFPGRILGIGFNSVLPVHSSSSSSSPSSPALDGTENGDVGSGSSGVVGGAELYVCTSSSKPGEMMLFTHNATRTSRQYDEFNMELVADRNSTFWFQGPYFVGQNRAMGTLSVLNCHTRKSVDFLLTSASTTTTASADDGDGEEGNNNADGHQNGGNGLGSVVVGPPPTAETAAMHHLGNFTSPTARAPAPVTTGLFAASKSGQLIAHWSIGEKLRVYTADGTLRCSSDAFLEKEMESLLIEDSGVIVAAMATDTARRGLGGGGGDIAAQDDVEPVATDGTSSAHEQQLDLYCLEIDFQKSSKLMQLARQRRKRACSYRSRIAARRATTAALVDFASETTATHSSSSNSGLGGSKSEKSLWNWKKEIGVDAPQGEAPGSGSHPTIFRHRTEYLARRENHIFATLDDACWRSLSLQEKQLRFWDTSTDVISEVPVCGIPPEAKIILQLEVCVADELLGAMFSGHGNYFAALISCDGTVTRTFRLGVQTQKHCVIAFHPNEALAVVATDFDEDVSSNLLLEALGIGIGNILYFGEMPPPEESLVAQRASDLYWWGGVLCYVMISIALMWTVTLLVCNGWLGHVQHLWRVEPPDEG